MPDTDVLSMVDIVATFATMWGVMKEVVSAAEANRNFSRIV
jgi:hypothetical protein